jgi:hypothetical protein
MLVSLTFSLLLSVFFQASGVNVESALNPSIAATPPPPFLAAQTCSIGLLGTKEMLLNILRFLLGFEINFFRISFAEV